VRAAVIVPALLALAFKVIGDPQLATYATFGAFANLVLAPFSGTRRDKLFAHLGLGLVGSVLLAIGTTVSGSTAVAGGVTLVVTFVVLLGGVAGTNAAAGGLAAMLAYVLSAASPGTASMIPARLEGWWLATSVAAVAVAVMSPRLSGDRLRATTAAAAVALGREATAVATGSADPALRTASLEGQRTLRVAFDATPFRPTGTATVDLALADMIELLEWVDSLIGDLVADLDQVGAVPAADSDLLECAGGVLVAVGGLLTGDDVTPGLDRLARLRLASADAVRRLGGDDAQEYEAAVHASFHSRTIAVAVRNVAADALIASRRADVETISLQRLQWLPAVPRAAPGPDRPVPPDPVRADGFPMSALAVVIAGATILARHASIRSVWLRNSARGAVAVAAAVTVADLTNVQHGFWVVLGTLSVLRTTATGTGGTVARALLGTAVGFVVGAALILAVGSDTDVLWLILPLAVLVAAYAPGVAPFAAGQAAFTAMLVVLYNLLVPVGWKVGEVRLEDIAIGCLISLVAGALFWPRGATDVVADDLHDAYVAASRYLIQSAEWALGTRAQPPDTARAAVISALRLDDALRAFLTEQGTKSIPKDDLWALVGAVQRIRLTAAALAELPPPPSTGPYSDVLAGQAGSLADWYTDVGTHILHGRPPELLGLGPFPPADIGSEPPGHRRSCQLYVQQHLHHLRLHHEDLIHPAMNVRVAAQRPWWRPGTPGPAPAGS
jgi:hypothetical protein